MGKNKKFKTGDLVKLNSGGPSSIMTIRDYFKPDICDPNYEENGCLVYCDWFDNNIPHSKSFHEDELVLQT